MIDVKAIDTMRRGGVELTVKEFATVVEDAVEYFTFAGVATTAKTDLVGDIVEPMGAVFSLPISLLSKHDSKKPIGEVYMAKATPNGVPYKARIPIVKEPGVVRERVLEAIHEVKYGLVKNVSIGFKAMLDAIEPLKDGGLRFLKWRWIELSLAPLPANDEATITSFKSLDADIRAALGALDKGDRRGEHNQRPGATGQRPKGTTMRTIKQMQERRDEIAARIKELNEGCGADFDTLGDDERAEFDALTKELSAVDVGIRRQWAVEVAANGATAITPDVGNDPAAASGARRGIAREPKQADVKVEKGIAFAQYVKYLGRAKGNPMHALAMAQRDGKRVDPRAALMLKASVEGGTVAGTPTAGNWGMELVGTETSAVADFLEFLRPTTILGKFGQGGVPSLNRVPFRVPLVGMTAGGTAYWVGEGKGKPLTKFGFSRNTLEPLTVAALTAVSNQLLADSSPAADPLIRNQLAAAVRETEDKTFIDPNVSASAGVSPASITNGVTPIPSSGNDAAGVRGDIKAVFGAFIAANNAPTTGVWVMSQQTALALSLMTNALGQTEDFAKNITMNGGSFGGLPVITSEYVPSDSTGAFVALVNAGQVYYGDDGEVMVATSEHASLEMVDNPQNDIITPAASAYSVSMFQTNSVAFRAERRIDWMRARDSAVALLSAVNWG